ncbi:MAG: class I SAM-dependent methyltransferase [Thermoleophilaceae bacterium]
MRLRVGAWGTRARLRRKADPPPSGQEWQRRTEELVRRHAPGGSFIDVGAMWQMHGRMPFVAEEAGATSVTALDAMDPTPEFEAERARRGSAVRFVQGDLHDPVTLEQVGPHDFVWCSGVIYHSPNPYLLIEHLRELTGRLIYLGTEIVPEVPGFEGACVFYPGLSEQARRAYGAVHGPGHDAIGVNRPFDPTPTLGYANYWWGITPSALRAMLATARLRIVEELHPDPFTMSVLAEPVPRESVIPPPALARERGAARAGRR